MCSVCPIEIFNSEFGSSTIPHFSWSMQPYKGVKTATSHPSFSKKGGNSPTTSAKPPTFEKGATSLDAIKTLIFEFFLSSFIVAFLTEVFFTVSFLTSVFLVAAFLTVFFSLSFSFLMVAAIVPPYIFDNIDNASFNISSDVLAFLFFSANSIAFVYSLGL